MARIRAPRFGRALLRDPLFQFVLLGGFLFAIDAAINSPTPSADALLSGPDLTGLEPAERERLLDTQRVLREARRLGLDRGDSIIERQLQQKLRLLVESRASREAPTDAQLGRFLADHREHYQEPESLDLHLHIVRRSEHGADARQVALALHEHLRVDPDTYAVEGDGHRQTLSGLPLDSVRRRFGRELAEAIDRMPLGEWSAPVAFGLGWAVVRVTARRAPPEPDFTLLRARLEADWLQARREAAWETELQRLREAAL